MESRIAWGSPSNCFAMAACTNHSFKAVVYDSNINICDRMKRLNYMLELSLYVVEHTHGNTPFLIINNYFSYVIT
jgi:hypothetical protein